MKILIVNTYENIGGAAIAANRLFKGLISLEHNAEMLVKYKSTDNSNVSSPQKKYLKAILSIAPTIDAIRLKKYKNRSQFPFTTALFKTHIDKHINKDESDIVHLHWINRGFLDIHAIGMITKPIVWTLHDMWPFTGGCHVNLDCEKYRNNCGACPVLNSKNENDLSKKIQMRKINKWVGKNITIVAPSKWLKECAENSSVFNNHKVYHIPNGISLELFKPIDKKVARKQLMLPPDKKLILFGAYSILDYNKGFDLLREALEKLPTLVDINSIGLVYFGTENPVENFPKEYSLYKSGIIKDDSTLCLLYSAVDVLVVTSRLENLPNVIMESCACGTPVVAFNVGGISDLVKHEYNGYLSKAFDTESLAHGIKWIINDKNRKKVLSHNARAFVNKNFNINIIANKYAELYSQILHKS